MAMNAAMSQADSPIYILLVTGHVSYLLAPVYPNLTVSLKSLCRLPLLLRTRQFIHAHLRLITGHL